MQEGDSWRMDDELSTRCTGMKWPRKYWVKLWACSTVSLQCPWVSTSMDPVICGLKIFLKVASALNMQTFLIILWKILHNNYLPSIYTVSVISKLEMVSSVKDDMCNRLHANTMPCYTSLLSTCRLRCLGPNQLTVVTEGELLCGALTTQCTAPSPAIHNG